MKGKVAYIADKWADSWDEDDCIFEEWILIPENEYYNHKYNKSLKRIVYFEIEED